MQQLQHRLKKAEKKAILLIAGGYVNSLKGVKSIFKNSITKMRIVGEIKTPVRLSPQ
jgi:hypothetical protein